MVHPHAEHKGMRDRTAQFYQLFGLRSAREVHEEMEKRGAGPPHYCVMGPGRGGEVPTEAALLLNFLISRALDGFQRGAICVRKI